jgi:hypothetical protein
MSRNPRKSMPPGPSVEMDDALRAAYRGLADGQPVLSGLPERVRKTVHRRRVHRLAAVGGTAAILVPAALIIALAGGGQNEGDQQIVVNTPSPSAATHTPAGTATPGSPSAAASPRSSSGPVPSASSAGTPANAVLPAGGAVPVGFEPASVTFVSQSIGYVLGTTSNCPSAPCTSMVRTEDGGAHWVGVPAPRVAFGPPAGTQEGSTVSLVRFADPLNGYAFDPGLWVTHDGARSWHQVDLSGQVRGLATAAGRVNLAVSACNANNCATGAMRLMSSPVTREAFTTVAAPTSGTGQFGGESSPLVLSPPAGFAELATKYPERFPAAVLYATADNATWSPFPDPCQLVANSELTSLAAPDATNLFSLCTGQAALGSSQKTVMLTRNGRSQVAGRAPFGGDGGQLAAPTPSTLVLATTSGASALLRSVDGGRTWSTTDTYADGGDGFVDLGFTTPTQGVVIHGRPVSAGEREHPNHADELLMTHDAGASWQHINF